MKNINKIINNTIHEYLNENLSNEIKQLKRELNYLENVELERERKKRNFDLFDEIVISAEVGFQKPQPEIFDVLFKRLGMNSNEIIFIDDTDQSLLGHETIGYLPIKFKNNEQFKTDLSKLLTL